MINPLYFRGFYQESSYIEMTLPTSKETPISAPGPFKHGPAAFKEERIFTKPVHKG